MKLCKKKNKKKRIGKVLQKPIIEKFEKRKVYSFFKDNIWGADIADMFEFIDSTSINRNISNLNARNTFELVGKDNSKYFLSSSYIRRINT